MHYAPREQGDCEQSPSGRSHRKGSDGADSEYGPGSVVRLLIAAHMCSSVLSDVPDDVAVSVFSESVFGLWKLAEYDPGESRILGNALPKYRAPID